MSRHAAGQLVTLVAAIIVVTVGALASAPNEAAAHRDPCHKARTCPSDHGKYRWHGLLCVNPKARERNSSFRLMYVHASYVYFCKR